MASPATTAHRTTRRGPVGLLRDLSTAKKLGAGFLLAMLPLLVVSLLTWQNVGTLDDNDTAVQHTYQVLDGIDQIVSTLKDAETGQRGFLITGEDGYLEPFTTASDAIGPAIDTVAELTADNPRQQERIASLRDLVQQKFAEMQSTIDVSRTQGFEAARQIVLGDAGKAVMDQIRGVVADMQDEESALLGERSASSESAQSQTRTTIVLSCLLGMLVVAVVATVLTRAITRPLRQAVGVLEGLAAGRLDQRLGVDTRDEVGAMGRALDGALDGLAEVMQQIGASAATLSAASEELSATSEQMTGSAEASATQAGSVSAAAEEVSRNVQTVAAGTEEMGASIREIAANAAQASEVAARAVAAAAGTTATVTRLGDSSAEIGNVVKVITSIAEQTNLLALNATIEAARAGEAGKGYAVVAYEVKELAQETARATEDIARRVEAIQGDTTAAVDAISEISSIVAQISARQTTIASAVEEQTATTNEMARNVAEAASGSSEIARTITGVAAAAQETTSGAGNTAMAAEDLSRMAGELQGLVGRFRL